MRRHRRTVVDDVTLGLAEINRQTAETLQDAANMIATDILARLKTRVIVASKRKPRAIQDQVRAAVASIRVDRSVFAAVNVDEAEFVSNAWSEYEVQAAKILERARNRKGKLVRAAAEELELDDDEIPVLPSEDQERSAIVTLVANLVGWTLGAIAAGRADTGIDELGERDISRVIPAAPFREALSIASLSPAADVGVGIGQTVDIDLVSWLAGIDRQQVGFTWVWGFYGTPAKPFAPHEELSGVVVAGLDDERLVNVDEFPAAPFYVPGDHIGCLCELVPVIPGE